MKYFTALKKYEKIIIGLIFFFIFPTLFELFLVIVFYNCPLVMDPKGVCVYNDTAYMVYRLVIIWIGQMTGAIILIWGIGEKIVLWKRKRKS